ncbi:MAG: uracil-DNA glycosylase [Pseudomonadota bacterium]
MVPSDRHALLQTLAWYEAMGVTDAVSDVPTDWLMTDADLVPVRALLGPSGGSASSARNRAPDRAAPARPAAQRSSGPDTAPSARTPGPLRQPAGAAGARPAGSDDLTDEAGSIAEAERLAAAADTLDALTAALHGFDGCPLKKTAKSLCVMRGAAQARLMLIGEGPGREEDQAGQPFVGRAGQLLDKMLAAIGHSDATAHIANVVYWRPPGNRTPTDFEMMVCRPFLERQVALVDPDIVVLLGGAAAKSIFDTPTGIMRTRGSWREITLGGRTRACVATLHPAYLLRTPAAKRLAWEDLLSVQARLDRRDA